MGIPKSIPSERPSSDDLYRKFIEDERNGQLVSCDDDLRCRWQHLRVTTCKKAFKKCYECPAEMRGRTGIFHSHATATLFSICNYQNVKPYQIGELLKFKANPSSQLDSTADTPLHRLISAESSIACIRLLIGWGAELNAKNGLGRSPLMIACDAPETKKSIRIVRFLLLSKMIDINARDSCGNSAGILAIKRSNIWIVRELLLSGMNVNTKGKMLHCNSTGQNIIQELSSVLDVSRRYITFAETIENKYEETLFENINYDSNRSNEEKIRFTKGFETGKKRKSNRDDILLTGIQYESPTILYVDSMYKEASNLCYLMLIRKSIEEKKNLENEKNHLEGLKKLHCGSLNKDIDNILHETITNYTNRSLKNGKELLNCDNLSLFSVSNKNEENSQSSPISNKDEIPDSVPPKTLKKISKESSKGFVEDNIDTRKQNGKKKISLGKKKEEKDVNEKKKLGQLTILNVKATEERSINKNGKQEIVIHSPTESVEKKSRRTINEIELHEEINKENELIKKEKNDKNKKKKRMEKEREEKLKKIKEIRTPPTSPIVLMILGENNEKLLKKDRSVTFGDDVSICDEADISMKNMKFR